LLTLLWFKLSPIAIERALPASLIVEAWAFWPLEDPGLRTGLRISSVMLCWIVFSGLVPPEIKTPKKSSESFFLSFLLFRYIARLLGTTVVAFPLGEFKLVPAFTKVTFWVVGLPKGLLRLVSPGLLSGELEGEFKAPFSAVFSPNFPPSFPPSFATALPLPRYVPPDTVAIISSSVGALGRSFATGRLFLGVAFAFVVGLFAPGVGLPGVGDGFGDPSGEASGEPEGLALIPGVGLLIPGVGTTPIPEVAPCPEDEFETCWRGEGDVDSSMRTFLGLGLVELEVGVFFCGELPKVPTPRKGLDKRRGLLLVFILLFNLRAFCTACFTAAASAFTMAVSIATFLKLWSPARFLLGFSGRLMIFRTLQPSMFPIVSAENKICPVPHHFKISKVLPCTRILFVSFSWWFEDSEGSRTFLECPPKVIELEELLSAVEEEVLPDDFFLPETEEELSPETPPPPPLPRLAWVTS
jgi:hypothetical protein